MADIPEGNLTERVIFGTLEPAARLSARLGLPLRRVKQLTELAYYREARRLGLKMSQIQELMSVGFSKVGTLSREWKQFGALSGAEVGLQRRVLLLLWSSPLTLSHLASAFPDSEFAEVEAVVAQMVEQGQLVEVPGRTLRYKVARNHNLLLRDDLLVRLNALQSLLGAVSQVVEARFFGRAGSTEDPSFARTLNFRARRQDLEKLERFYRESLFPLIEELDGAVEADEEDSIPIKLALVWVRDSEMDQANTRSRRAGSEQKDQGEEA